MVIFCKLFSFVFLPIPVVSFYLALVNLLVRVFLLIGSVSLSKIIVNMLLKITNF